MRFHLANSLETAGDYSLLVRGSTEVQVNWSVPKAIHKFEWTRAVQGRCRDGAGDKYNRKTPLVEEF
jgi:hypothetical protein